jgi:hypothetical protein
MTWDGLEYLNGFMVRFWNQGNYFCQKVEQMNGNRTHQQEENQEKQEGRILLRLTFGCREAFKKSYLGTGNFVSGLYAIRLAARAIGNVDVELVCHDAEKEKTKLILPWLMGVFPNGASHLASDHGANIAIPTKQQACSSYKKCPTGHMLPIIRYELRGMAIALVGIPDANHPATAFAERYLWNDNSDAAFANNTMLLRVRGRGARPLIPNVQLGMSINHAIS